MNFSNNSSFDIMTQNPYNPQTIHQRTQNAYFEDMTHDHTLIQQLSDAHKTIVKQDEIITNLRTDSQNLQSIIAQKDSIIKKLELHKYQEANDLNKFYLERIKTESLNISSNETPRIQNENAMIRDQIKVLLEEAKERNHDISRLKKVKKLNNKSI